MCDYTSSEALPLPSAASAKQSAVGNSTDTSSLDAAVSAEQPASLLPDQGAGVEHWEILYHGLPVFKGKGRGEPLRLMLEDSGLAYSETNDGLYGPKGITDAFRRSPEAIALRTQEMPLWCPPIVRHTTAAGETVYVSNSPAIMRYMGECLGYAPEGLAAKAACDTLVCNLVDFLAEGRASFHPVDLKGSYYNQVEEAKVASAKFASERLKYFLAHLDKWITIANERRQQERKASLNGTAAAAAVDGEDVVVGGESASAEESTRSSELAFAGPVIGDAVSYADFYLFYFLDATRAQFGGPEYDGAWDNAPTSVVSYHAWFSSRPRIAAYEASGRRKPWEGNSMM